MNGDNNTMTQAAKNPHTKHMVNMESTPPLIVYQTLSQISPIHIINALSIPAIPIPTKGRMLNTTMTITISPNSTEQPTKQLICFIPFF